MSAIAAIALQGLTFQATRLAVAAANIVAAGVSAPATADGRVLAALYQPRSVEGVSLAGGGVTAKIVPLDPAYVLMLDARSPTGLVAMPADTLVRDMVTLMSASASYRAALKLLAVDAELSGALLDATA